MLFGGLLCLAGGAQAVAQCPNRALDFDGFDDAVTCTLSPTLGNSNFTFEAWFSSTASNTSLNCTDPGTFRRLFQLRGGGFSPNTIDIGECNGYVTVAWNDPVLHGPYQTAPIYIRGNGWHHVAMVKTATEILVYLDCALIFTATDHASVGTFNIVAATLGASPFAASTFWQGRVDEVKLFPVARTAARICDERFCLRDGKNMSLYWHMDQGMASGASIRVSPSW